MKGESVVIWVQVRNVSCSPAPSLLRLQLHSSVDVRTTAPRSRRGQLSGVVHVGGHTFSIVGVQPSRLVGLRDHHVWDWLGPGAPVANAGHDFPDVRLSDHSPFLDAGYNAMMITDTSFMRNPHYHQASDTVDTLDLPFLMAVINGLEAALSALYLQIEKAARCQAQRESAPPLSRKGHRAASYAVRQWRPGLPAWPARLGAKLLGGPWIPRPAQGWRRGGHGRAR